VLDPHAHRRVDVQLVQLARVDECDFLALADRPQLTADDAGVEADGELLADLAVVYAMTCPGFV
jgi:hypothetical protein